VCGIVGLVPGRYYRLMEPGMLPVERRLKTAEPNTGLAELDATPPLKDLPSSILAGPVLYASSHPTNTARGDARWLGLALRIGDLLAAESVQGPPQEVMNDRNRRWGIDP